MNENDSGISIHDLCKGCGKIIGLSERVNGQPTDGPADRWHCPNCDKDYCLDCYGRDHPLAALNHDCTVKAMDTETRFGVGAGGSISHEKV